MVASFNFISNSAYSYNSNQSQWTCAVANMSQWMCGVADMSQWMCGVADMSQWMCVVVDMSQWMCVYVCTHVICRYLWLCTYSGACL